jgi:hypothetical protein
MITTTTTTSSTTPVRHRMGAVALAVGAGFAGLGLITPATANADVTRCNAAETPGGILDVREFSVQQIGDGNTLVTVEVMANMTQSSAREFIDHPGEEAIFRLWGDDPDSDDQLAEKRPDVVWASSQGLGLRGAFTVPWSTLDSEDSPIEADEWYAGIRLQDVRSGLEHKVETCRLTNG